MANIETRKLRKEVERLKARIEIYQLKEMKLLDELIQLQDLPEEIKCKACGTRNRLTPTPQTKDSDASVVGSSPRSSTLAIAMARPG